MLGKSPGRGGRGGDEGAMGACLFDGLDTMVVRAAVAIGVEKWTRVWLHGRLDGQR